MWFYVGTIPLKLKVHLFSLRIYLCVKSTWDIVKQTKSVTTFILDKIQTDILSFFYNDRNKVTRLRWNEFIMLQEKLFHSCFEPN